MSTGTFVLFGTSHVAAVVTCIVLIAVAIHAISLASDSAQEHAFRWVRWLVVVGIFLFRGVFLLKHEFRIDSDLPVAVCSVSTILLAVYFWRPKQAIFDILFYWVLIGSSLALLLPDLVEPFPSLRFFSMFATHGLNLFALFYLLVIHRDTPSDDSYSLAFRALAVYGLLFALPVDWLLHANYLYMLSPPAVNLAVMEVLPPWPWYWIVLLVFFYGAFRFAHAVHAHYFPSMPVSSERFAE